MADAHDVTIIGTKEVEGIVGFLDNQKLAGHFGKVEIVADMGFLYFAEGYGYGEVFYHDTVIWCKDRIFRRKRPCPSDFRARLAIYRLLCTSVIRNGCPVAAGIENDKNFGLFLLQAFVLAQGVEYPFTEQFRAIGVDAEAEKYDRFQIIIGNDAFVLFLGCGYVAVIKQAGFEDGAHIGVYCLHEHSEQTGKFVLGHPYVAVLYLYTDDGLFILVSKPVMVMYPLFSIRRCFLNGVTI